MADRLRNARSKDERRSLYGEVYRLRSERIPHHPLVRRAKDDAASAAAVKPQVALLRPFLTPESRFCELGAGDGAVARAISPLVGSALALDVTDALALPNEARTGFEFRVFDGFELGLPGCSLDLAYSHDVVEHLHPDDLLDQARSVQRSLRPGGMYVCVTPNRISGPHDISRHFSSIPQGFHLREYTATELAGVFREAGFSRVKIVVAVNGRHLSPLLPTGLARPLEATLGALPNGVRRPLSLPLAALKVVAIC
ncbi:MAG: class I SAM-dependent methyltransferase [Solirubrobacterales bacterium]|nr:class I SAM-dependent methyltransferase [Solirubrobacterales bacterium]